VTLQLVLSNQQAVGLELIPEICKLILGLEELKLNKILPWDMTRKLA
jgi:hypothetical protein